MRYFNLFIKREFIFFHTNLDCRQVFLVVRLNFMWYLSPHKLIHVF